MLTRSFHVKVYPSKSFKKIKHQYDFCYPQTHFLTSKNIFLKKLFLHILNFSESISLFLFLLRSSHELSYELRVFCLVMKCLSRLSAVAFPNAFNAHTKSKHAVSRRSTRILRHFLNYRSRQRVNLVIVLHPLWQHHHDYQSFKEILQEECLSQNQKKNID